MEGKQKVKKALKELEANRIRAEVGTVEERAHVRQVDRVLASLPERQRDALKAFCCGREHPTTVAIRLAQEWYISESTVWRLYREALREFAYRMGYVETRGKG